MITKFAYLSLAISCLFTTVTTGQVLVEDTNIVLLEDSQIPEFTQLTVFQDIEADDPTSIFFSIESGPSPELITLNFEAITLDEGSDWYLTELNDTFSEASIATGVHTIFGGVDIAGEIDVPIGDFYLGVNTGSSFPPDLSNRNIFGWAHFNIDADLNLQLIDNAVAYDTDRIIIGQNAVPEPSAIGVLCALIIAHQLRRTKRGI